MTRHLGDSPLRAALDDALEEHGAWLVAMLCAPAPPRPPRRALHSSSRRARPAAWLSGVGVHPPAVASALPEMVTVYLISLTCVSWRVFVCAGLPTGALKTTFARFIISRTYVIAEGAANDRTPLSLAFELVGIVAGVLGLVALSVVVEQKLRQRAGLALQLG